MIIKLLLVFNLAYGATGTLSLQQHLTSQERIPLNKPLQRNQNQPFLSQKRWPLSPTHQPPSFLQTSSLSNSVSSSRKGNDSTPDGNIPILDVQMIAPKRWLASNREFKNLQRELSFFIDQELDKEKKRLLDREDARLESTKSSLLHLIPSSDKKSDV